MTRYFLGTDTGSTKSHAIVADETGQAVGFGLAGPGNPQNVGFDGLVRLLDDMTSQATSQAGIDRSQIAGVGFGIAGYDWPSQHRKFENTVAPLGLDAKIEFANDAVVGLLAGVTAGWGVAVVSGTSCNCRGRDRQGREGRVTGYGPAFGEYGGAHELAMLVAQAISLEWSRRGPATLLTPTMIEYTKARDLDDLMEGLTTEHLNLDSQIARIVFQVAAAGDRVAAEIIDWTGRQLGELANGVIRQLSLETEEVEVIMVGSLWSGGSMLIEPMQKTVLSLAPQARFVRLAAPPVVGGVLLGMQQAGFNGWAVRDRLIESTNAIIAGRASGAPVDASISLESGA
jgi:N-acetylglucosamine kinase-like BadF-type ATPase